MNKCRFCRELFITESISSSKEHERLFKLCFNTITMVIRPGGVLLQDCTYNEGHEYECPFNKEVN